MYVTSECTIEPELILGWAFVEDSRLKAKSYHQSQSNTRKQTKNEKQQKAIQFCKRVFYLSNFQEVRKNFFASKMAKTAKKVKEYELDLRKVRDTMKKLNVKNMKKESVEKVAAALEFIIENNKKKGNHLKGKMLAALRSLENWCRLVSAFVYFSLQIDSEKILEGKNIQK